MATDCKNPEKGLPMYLNRLLIPTLLVLSVAACGGGGGSSSEPNQPPSVDAGLDLSTYSRSTVTLSAAASDVDGTVQSYQWQQTAGSPTVTMDNADTTEASFTVPVLTSETTLSFSVTVTDDHGATATDIVDVYISPLVQGFFSYGPVQGLNYETATRSGVTGADGSFLYTEGETITFSVGTVQLGDSVTAKQGMTPLDLIDGATLFTTSGDFRRWYELSEGRDRTAFRRFANTLSFLQTLDEDGDPDNGIVIPAEIGSMFDGIAIDFSKDFSNFRDVFNGNPALRYVAQKAASEGVLASGRIRNGLLALQQYYSSQGIAYSASIPSRQDSYESGDMSTPWYSYEWGVDADGNVTYYKEGSDSYRSTFDDNGNVLSRVTDSGDDGVDDAITTYTYDTRGNLLTESTDSNADGTPNIISGNTYDATGNKLSYTVDSNGDGVQDAAYSYTYDGTFHLLTMAYYQGTSTIAKFVYSFSYTPEGRLETEEHDSNNDGTADYRATNTYDAAGNRTAVSSDNNGDGTVDEVDYRTYDAAGNVLSRGTDRNNDGTIDSKLFTWSYQPITNLILSYTNDANADGIPDYLGNYTYNTDGREVRFESDGNGDGVIDFAEVRTYDEDGNRISNEWDYEGDGVVDDSETMTYDANGFLLQDDYDYDNDGVVDSRYSYTPTAATWNSMMIWLEGTYY